MQIKVFGTGCANCRATVALLEQVAREKGVSADIAKVEDVREIAAAGVMATPAVAIDGALVHGGGIPSRARVEQWLSAFAPCCGCGAGKPASR